MTGSRLFYHGTNIEVQLGDRVEVTKGILFRRRVGGSVVYLPGVSERHPEMADETTSDWAIGLDDGTVMSWLYLPEELQPSKRIRFMYRKDPHSKPIQPTDELL